MYQNGYRWGAINVADNNWSDWSVTIKRFAQAGLRTPVWGRVQNTSVEQIMLNAIYHNRPCILNIEDEFKTRSPADFNNEIREIRLAHPNWKKALIINTVGWLYNDIDYKPIARRPVQLQIMVDDMKLTPADLPRVTNDCIVHARDKGFSDISVTFQAFSTAHPEWYDFWKLARNYFTGDWIGAQAAWPQWKVPV